MGFLNKIVFSFSEDRFCHTKQSGSSLSAKVRIYESLVYKGLGQAQDFWNGGSDVKEGSIC